MTQHKLPKKALDHHIAIIGKTGSGKTSIGKAEIVEPALDAGERVVMIDPTGAWWGLRLKANGKSKGYPVYIFGGRHADKPLIAAHGEILAEFIGKTATPCILDTSLMKNSERTRFFTDFADAILRANESQLRIVIDEAHVFMPQAGTRGAGAMPDMLHAGNNLISLGRSRGIRCVLISQRPAKLHKDSLTQVETLIAARLIAPQDREAVRAWIADQADLEKGKQIIASLPELAAGEAWCWSPESKFLKQVQFPKPATFDSSSGIIGKKSKKLPALDVKALDARLAKVDAETKEHDPKALREEIAKLKKQIGAKPVVSAVQAPAQPSAALKKSERKAEFARGAQAARKIAEAWARNLLAEVEKKFDAIEEKFRAEVRGALPALKNLKLDFKKLPESSLGLSAAPPHSPSEPGRPSRAIDTSAKAPVAAQASPSLAAKNRKPLRTPEGVGGALPKPHQKILDAIAWFEKIGIKPVDRDRVAVFCGWSPTASTASVHCSRMAADGLIVSNGKMIEFTEAGARAALWPEAISRGDLHRAAISLLKSKQIEIFNLIYNAYPNAVAYDEICDALNISRTASTLSVHLSKIRNCGLLDESTKGRNAKAADWLFPNI